MLNREYHVRANRQGRRLEGQQLDISFPRRGRPSRFKRLERAGQMRLELLPINRRTRKPEFVTSPVEKSEGNSRSLKETFESALDLCFPERALTELELTAEFERLFPPEA